MHGLSLRPCVSGRPQSGGVIVSAQLAHEEVNGGTVLARR
ncbi:hypothetical protein MA6G0125S_4491 [Mycobacteroides abscessus 6G-0125-S]|nr:hypothetical protein MA6G0125S_4491 [Mycobacteroides abscessus 6G-0125-S]